MTCIVGLEHEGAVWIGGDSTGVNYSLDIHARDDRKVFQVGEAVIGFTGSFRFGQVLQYRLEFPQINTWDVYRWAAVDFMDAVRKACAAGGILEKRNEVETAHNFLMGVRGMLFYCGPDFQMGRVLDGYAAVGCGAPFALGCLHRIQNEGQPPVTAQTRLLRALEAAAHHSAGVRGPFTILECPANADQIAAQ